MAKASMATTRRACRLGRSTHSIRGFLNLIDRSFRTAGYILNGTSYGASLCRNADARPAAVTGKIT